MALATVVPGLITLAVVFCALAIAEPAFLTSSTSDVSLPSEWVVAGVAVTVMVLTQAFGILLEELLIRAHLLGAKGSRIRVPGGCGDEDESYIDPYEQYQRLYITLAQLSEHEDSQGHLKRAVAQFFLTNNTLVAFTAGLVVSLVLAGGETDHARNLYIYAIGLGVCLVVSYLVAVIRFRVMAKALWATQVAARNTMERSAG